MNYRVPHFVNGAQLNITYREGQIFNPATGKTIGQVGFGNSDLVNKGVQSSLDAYQTWSRLAPLKRAKILQDFKRVLEQSMDELVSIVTREHGKTLGDAKGSIQRGLDVLDFATGIPAYLQGTFAENVATEVDCFSMRQSVGICVGITPFNFPAMVPLWMLSMALACGNTFILKPSEKDPSCALRLAELAFEAGVPPGVLNVIHGDKEVVDALITHPHVQAISFVGSSPIAEYVYHTGTAHNKRVQAFGGAKNHCVVMPDANIADVTDVIMGAAYGSTGQRCMAISAVIAVGDEIADCLVNALKGKLPQLKIGAGHASNVDIGPLITEAQLNKVKDYIDAGVAEGAELVIDGRQHQACHSEGYFLGPCLFDHVQPSMKIYQEEIFGPVLVILRVSDFETALKLVNEHPYGNGSAIFTQSGYAASHFVSQVQTGMVGVNIPIPVPVAFHSFGGWKRSIFGDIGMHGTEAIHFFTRLKTVTQRWVKDPETNLFNMPVFHTEKAK